MVIKEVNMFPSVKKVSFPFYASEGNAINICVIIFNDIELIVITK